MSLKRFIAWYQSPLDNDHSYLCSPLAVMAICAHQCNPVPTYPSLHRVTCIHSGNAVPQSFFFRTLVYEFAHQQYFRKFAHHDQIRTPAEKIIRQKNYENCWIKRSSRQIFNRNPKLIRATKLLKRNVQIFSIHNCYWKSSFMNCAFKSWMDFSINRILL